MQSAREQLGESDAPVEDEVVEAFDRIVDEGAQRLHRSWREVLTTGLAGGLEVATGVVALLAVYAATGSHLLAGLAFGIGFIALMLAKSELFTEGFLVPVTAVVAGRASAAQLGKLWAGTLVANLVGGWLVMWLVVHALPDLGADSSLLGAAEIALEPLFVDPVAALGTAIDDVRSRLDSSVRLFLTLTLHLDLDCKSTRRLRRSDRRRYRSAASPDVVVLQHCHGAEILPVRITASN